MSRPHDEEPQRYEGTIALWLALAACLCWWLGWTFPAGFLAFFAFFAFIASIAS